MAISHHLEELGDVSLKSVVEGARKNIADGDITLPALWEGVAQAGERELQRRKAWKSSKGKWFAVAQRTIWRNHDRRSGDVDVIEFIECDGQPAAIKACREMLKKYADQFDETVTIDVEIHPEIEWRPPDR